MIYFIFHIVMTAVLLGFILILTYFINSSPKTNYSKLSSYECGFEPFGGTKLPFNIQFFTVGLLFIIFDIEVVFLVPFVIDITNLSIFGYFVFIIFFFIMVLGFFFEWINSLLEWE